MTNRTGCVLFIEQITPYFKNQFHVVLLREDVPGLAPSEGGVSRTVLVSELKDKGQVLMFCEGYNTARVRLGFSRYPVQEDQG